MNLSYSLLSILCLIILISLVFIIYGMLSYARSACWYWYVICGVVLLILIIASTIAVGLIENPVCPVCPVQADK